MGEMFNFSSDKSNPGGGRGGRSGAQAGKRSAADVLREACDRNIPICVVRPREAGRVPMARGRMLSMADGLIDIDRVQVPGLEIKFRRDDELEGYFSIGQSLYQFRTTLTKICEPKRLNARMVIPGMTLTEPAVLQQGDRRNIFRVSVSALEDRPTVSVWRLIEQGRSVLDEPGAADDGVDGAEDAGDESNAGGMPSMAFNVHGVELSAVRPVALRPVDFSGWIVDATEQGIGVRLEAVGPGRFTIFEPLLIRIALPASALADENAAGDPISFDFIGEVRAKRAVGDDGCRLGLVLIEDTDALMQRRKRDVLRSYLARVQREQLRKGRGRAG